MTVGKGEIENITVGKWGGGCSTNRGGGEGEMGLAGLSCLGPWVEPWALKIS